MTVKEDLATEVGAIFRTAWVERDGEQVPESEDLGLGNDAVKLEATCFYADLADSTGMVTSKKPTFSAEIYKAFLLCAAKIIRSHSGVITAYDGDRIMAVFIGRSKNTSAVRSALELNHAVREIVTPAMLKAWQDSGFRPEHAVGIDTSKLFIARTGVRGANDLVWVGRAANYAAKLATLRGAHRTYITSDVFDNIHESVKTHQGRSMWDALSWTEHDRSRIYGSTWWFTIP
jgi:class 3 adenylate cyclase